MITTESKTSRRKFLVGVSAAGAGMVAVAGIPGLALAESVARGDLASGDKDILVAAGIAEALAVTTYGNIISTSPWFKHIPADDQNYFRAAHNEEMTHYDLEKSLTKSSTPYTKFYYPKHMFHSAQTTLDTLVTLEDAFIAAYLVGVRNFSNSGLREASARIMGIESDHRTLARVIGGNVSKMDGGPIKKITGIQGHAESINPPNNNGYERTLGWTKISQAVSALMPFIDKTAAGKAGFDTSKSFAFHPFKPTLPSPYGAY